MADTHSYEDGEVIVLDSFEGRYISEAEIEQSILGDVVPTVRIVRVAATEDAFGHIEDALGLLVWHHIVVDRAFASRLRRCKGIIRTGVGFDKIDLAATTEFGIPVANIPDYGTEEVADHTMALLLAAVRRLRVTDRHVRDGGWSWESIGTVGRLRGRTLGIIGFGRIGRAVCIRAQAFGLRIGFYDPYVPSGTDKVHGVTRYASLDELLSDADFVSVHAPLTNETRGFIGDEQFARMKADAILVNTARGGIVDRDALIAAVGRQAIAQFALDVVDGEPDIPDAVKRSDNVLITPHSAFYCREGMRELRVKAAQHMRALLLDQPVRDVLNLDA